MSGVFEEFHDELRSVASDLLAKDAAVEWPLLADAGWTGLEAPESSGRGWWRPGRGWRSFSPGNGWG